ncbi:hypothetical protein HDR66_02815 [bacterium]|nr:hypothetical protein [bacterium]
MQLNQVSAEKIMADLGMDDLPLMALRPGTAQLPPDWFTQYKNARHQFMQGLIDAVEELAMLNLNQSEFMDLVMGRAMPQNMSIRMRVPLIWGGDITPANMFMCSTFPHANNIDRFIISQIGNDLVWVPNPAKKVYVPAHTAGGGDGGNATDDRMSQIAAQMAMGHGME